MNRIHSFSDNQMFYEFRYVQYQTQKAHLGEVEFKEKAP